MNTADLLKHNNELRSQLNEDNKKYYEELLVTCRIKNTTKNESALEIQLLEILHIKNKEKALPMFLEMI